MLVMGIESSCDETAVAIVNNNKKVLSHKLVSQIEEHLLYGGVVPEIAARNHLAHIDNLIRESLLDSNLKLEQIDAFAASSGPGLIGGLIVGVMTAKTLASIYNKPFIAVNHLEAHALTIRFVSEIDFPYLLLLVSGGHCQLLIVEGVGQYRCLGTTLDDAVGECFDKVAKMLGLEMPGGPAVQHMAKLGDSDRFSLPLPLRKRKGCDFSFSGLKTAVRNKLDLLNANQCNIQDLRDLAASLQKAAINHLIDRTNNAFDLLGASPIKSLVVSGGVASNDLLRSKFYDLSKIKKVDFFAPPRELCTDNGIMVAWAGLDRHLLELHDPLTFKPKPRWPLETLNNNM